MSQVTKSAYSFAADLIRCWAIMGVISIHTLIAVYARPDFVGGSSWWLSAVWNALSRPAIPLFVMLSGSLLLPKKETATVTYQRVVQRLLIPLVSWLVIYTVWNGGQPSISELNPFSLLTKIWFGQVGPLYYLLIAGGLYSLLPVLRRTYGQWQSKTQLVTIAVLMTLSMVIVALEYRTGVFWLNHSLLMWAPYLGYFLLGSWLADLRLTRVWQLLFLGSYLFSIAGLTAASYYQQVHLSTQSWLAPIGSLSPYWDFHFNLVVVTMSVALFVLLFQVPWEKVSSGKFFPKVVKQISATAYGLYLTHLLVMQFLESQLQFSIDYIQWPLPFYLVVKFVVVFSGAYVITIALKKMPMLKKLVGE